MPALPANVVRASRRSRVVSVSDSGVFASYPGARDSAEEPEAGYFDSASDASAALALKQALIGTSRRRFRVELAEEFEIDPLDEIPTGSLVDDELGFSGPVLPARIEVNLDAETSTIEVMG